MVLSEARIKAPTTAHVKLSISSTATKFKLFATRMDGAVTAAPYGHGSHRTCSLLSKEGRGRQVNSSGLLQFASVCTMRMVEQLINIHSLAHHVM